MKAIHGKRCVICGTHPVQIHHVVHRARALLRHDPKNGLPLCIDCHNIADTILGRTEVAKHVDMDYLAARERVTFKDYLVRNGLTRANFLNNQLAKLKAICENESDW